MFCYDEFSLDIFSSLTFGLYSPEVPVLIYYSHLTAIIVALVLSGFIIINNRSLPARILATMAVVFSALSILDILLWTQIDSRLLMFLWSFWPFLFLSTYVLSLYFLHAFIRKCDIQPVTKFSGGTFLALALGWAISSYNLEAFDLYNCNAVESFWAWNAVYIISLLLFLFTILYGFVSASRQPKGTRRGPVLATIGVGCFLLVFSAAAYIASIANFLGSEPDIFRFEQYGYFGMAIFIAFLTYTIVEYRAFNIKLVAAQALVAALVILIGSQFFFIRNPVNYNLNAIALILSLGFGYLLVKSVKREVEQREHIEKLARELEKANEQQVVLIHFITHQIKGFVTKSRNIFSMLLEGDFGQLPESMKPMVEEGLRSDTKGANTIQEILNAANIKSGKVTYTKQPLDFRALITEILSDLKPGADAKGLSVNLTSMNGDYTLTGDRMQLVNAIKNLIDNSIKYTPKGSVDVSLTRDNEHIKMVVKDTGVGITPEDMQVLFTEGGHGKDSTKINVDSTGFGLYIVKNIIEAHHGRVWAESEGPGKGSSFIVELPAS